MESSELRGRSIVIVVVVVVLVAVVVVVVVAMSRVDGWDKGRF